MRNIFSKVLIPVMLLAWGTCACAADSSQSPSVKRLNKYLRKMDANGNGYLESSEISREDLPYVHRLIRTAKLNAARSVSIDKLSRKIAEYNQRREPSGSHHSAFGRPGTPQGSKAGKPVAGFGNEHLERPIPGFGTEKKTVLPYKVIQADIDLAMKRIKQYDRNHDGRIDKEEFKRGSWFGRPLDFDRNKDSALDRAELATRYAWRRYDKEKQRAEKNAKHSSGQSTAKQSRSETKHSDRHARHSSKETSNITSSKRISKSSPKRTRSRSSDWDDRRSMVHAMFDRYDADDSGYLEGLEAAKMGMSLLKDDSDGDGRISQREVARWLKRQALRKTRQLPKGLPDWFAALDADHDGQIMMAEFAQRWTEAKAAAFVRIDANRDGIITPAECLGSLNLTFGGGTYSNAQLQVILPRSVGSSTIKVVEDYVIADIDVKLSITHTYDEWLDVYLIGPRGERVELFTAVGSHDDHFDNTVLDDEAQTPIREGFSPFRGTYQPESVANRSRSLRHFYGKKITGTWRLEVQTKRSARPALLHGWSLIVKPADVAQQGKLVPRS